MVSFFPHNGQIQLHRTARQVISDGQEEGGIQTVIKAIGIQLFNQNKFMEIKTLFTVELQTNKVLPVYRNAIRLSNFMNGNQVGKECNI